ncbi:cation:proton antiporter [Cellulomonas phragmiteti]|uniref:Sodium:proton antiporter n=1 Tax=Cellulomonas phragmiteti TaxID=478780 RepID=A0ABQ4DQE9_9CELL|nr:monovalent cation/H(+) antiporter subunit G [Cellulomonas phragmiteti]GIG41567.1 hypothetical protein Cph01nite_33290 [Cellulomonas phragmiteti]
MILQLMGDVLAVIGAAVFVVAAIGLWRFRDPYARISSVATAAGVGVVLVTVGAALSDPEVGTVTKVVLAVALQLVTSAVGGIAIARAAVESGHVFAAGTDTEGVDGLPEQVP